MAVSPPNSEAIQYLWEQLHKLEPSSQLGGIYANKPGYHNTRANNSPNNYSVVDSQDKGGPSNLAAALDWTFPEAQHGDYSRISKYAARLLASGQDPHDDRLNWMREFYGQADKDSAVEGWDYRYVVAVSSDDSHLWHIHFSFSRNALTIANMDKLLEVLRGGDSVTLSDADARKVWRTDGAVDNSFEWREDSPQHDPPGTNKDVQGQTAIQEAAGRANRAFQSAERANEKLDQIIAGGFSIIVGPELLKQIMLDPLVVETYAKAIAEKIVGINFEIAE